MTVITFIFVSVRQLSVVTGTKWPRSHHYLIPESAELGCTSGVENFGTGSLSSLYS